jgi:hypothetical protein
MAIFLSVACGRELASGYACKEKKQIKEDMHAATAGAIFS